MFLGILYNNDVRIFPEATHLSSGPAMAEIKMAIKVSHFKKLKTNLEEETMAEDH